MLASDHTLSYEIKLKNNVLCTIGAPTHEKVESVGA